MVEAGDTIENTTGGERIIFRDTAADTGGEALVVEAFLGPNGYGLRRHVHPGQEERLQVLRGRLGIQIGRRRVVLGPGQRVTVPPGTPHAYWNDCSEPAQLIVEVRPALGLESFLEILYGLSAAPTEARSAKRFLQLAVVADEYFDTVRLARPHRLVQRAALSLAAPLGRALGLEPPRTQPLIAQGGEA